jgi:hypothetical protein
MISETRVPLDKRASQQKKPRHCLNQQPRLTLVKLDRSSGDRPASSDGTLAVLRLQAAANPVSWILLPRPAGSKQRENGVVGD